jgi:predicted nucleotidyltransferase
MRLTPEQITVIKSNTTQVYGDSAKVYLFGSRVDDNAKGGDIDLFIESDQNVTLTDKLQLMTLLQLALGDRKIDIIVKDVSAKSQPIFNIAKNTGCLL